jgi:hypothetical protein
MSAVVLETKRVVLMVLTKGDQTVWKLVHHLALKTAA